MVAGEKDGFSRDARIIELSTRVLPINGHRFGLSVVDGAVGRVAGEDGFVDDDAILEMWAHRAGFPSRLAASDVARGWWNPETAFAVRRAAASTWQVDIENRGARTIEAVFAMEADADRFLLMRFGVLWRLERGFDDCFPLSPAEGVDVEASGSGYTVRAGTGIVEILSKRQAIRFSHVAGESLAAVSARLMT
ncbi:hypothetical protein [Microbacterium enclense]|nr:hypothetical protein [Microbacterium enclense]KSU54979.1 hypothetical protein AS029_05890 [Microbacterium enclense]